MDGRVIIRLEPKGQRVGFTARRLDGQIIERDIESFRKRIGEPRCREAEASGNRKNRRSPATLL